MYSIVCSFDVYIQAVLLIVYSSSCTVFRAVYTCTFVPYIGIYVHIIVINFIGLNCTHLFSEEELYHSYLTGEGVDTHINLKLKQFLICFTSLDPH